MRINNIYKGILSIAALSLTWSCSEGWLETKPLSFYTPENTLVDAPALYSALAAAERNMRHEYTGDGAPILTEFMQSDLCVEGTTDKSGPQMNMDVHLLPDANLNSTNTTKAGWYWYEAFKAVKYSNLVISYINNAEFSSEAEYNAVLGAAYFQRAYRYYRMVHQFGDVPFLELDVSEPRCDFNTNDRWSILRRLKNELEFAWEWVPKDVSRGATSKGACGVLLMKVCMSLGEFDRAIELGKEIVAMHPLMTSRFTSNASIDSLHLLFDLHSVEAKYDMSNTEGILYVVSTTNEEGSTTMQIMRNAVPFWNHGSVITPDGKTGTTVYPSSDETRDYMDLNRLYGRGIGRLRPTNFFQYGLWGEKEKNDMRGIYDRRSWRAPEDLHYNHSNLKATNSQYYGANLIKPVAMAIEDTIRCWYQWPHYKVYVPDPLSSEVKGGDTPWYVYRSAEVYLMLAESYYWKDDLASAATMMNFVRTRAGADPLTAADVTMGEILKERGRELYYEEHRHTELSRISYTYALTGKTCEEFGVTYSLDNISGPGGTGANVKQAGVNFFWDWVNKYNNFYNKGVVHKWAEYLMSVHHILWPVPADAITANTGGVINQNVGYPGAENNIEPLMLESEERQIPPEM